MNPYFRRAGPTILSGVILLAGCGGPGATETEVTGGTGPDAQLTPQPQAPGGDLPPNTSDLSCRPGDRRECFSGEATQKDVGACRSGEQHCLGSSEFGSWGVCAGQILPSVEVCGDGIDQDCNGVDEACGTPPNTTSPPDAGPADSAPPDQRPPGSAPQHNGQVGQQCIFPPGVLSTLSSVYHGHAVELLGDHSECASDLCLLMWGYHMPQPEYRCTQACNVDADCPPPDAGCPSGYFCFGVGINPTPIFLTHFVCGCWDFVTPLPWRSYGHV